MTATGARVNVALADGRLRVHALADVYEVQVVSVRPRLSTDARAARAAAEVAVEQAEGGFRVSVPDVGRGRPPEVLLDLVVPLGATLQADSGAAEVVCTGRLGRLQVRASSGSVHAETVDGPLQVSTARGPVTVHHCHGPVTVSTASGVVLLREVTQPATVTTGSGDVHVWWLAAPARVATSTGNVRLGWARGRPVALDLATTGGRVQVGVPSVGGGDLVQVVSVSGDIRVEPADRL